MKLSVSNIAWGRDEDQQVYEILSKNEFSGIEIAPTRLVSAEPYSVRGMETASAITQGIRDTYGLAISSMQSIWFGVTQNLFGPPSDREFLLNYMFKAIRFANQNKISHIVFGCPKNRVLEHPEQRSEGDRFFTKCAEYAQEYDVVIGVEANPSIYGTNYLNSTDEVYRLVRRVDHPNCRINYDLGTVIINEEDIYLLEEYLPYVSHIHISEPMLDPVADRPEHEIVASILRQRGYEGWVSIEMKNSGLDKLGVAIQTISKRFI